MSHNSNAFGAEKNSECASSSKRARDGQALSENTMRAQWSVPDLRSVEVPNTERQGRGHARSLARQAASSIRVHLEHLERPAEEHWPQHYEPPSPMQSPAKQESSSNSQQGRHTHIDSPHPKLRSRSASDSRVKSKPRPRAPPTPSPRLPSATSSPFMPPSHFAAAAGLPYPVPKSREYLKQEFAEPVPPLKSYHTAKSFLKDSSDATSISSHTSSFYPSSISTAGVSAEAPMPFLPISPELYQQPLSVSVPSKPLGFLARSLSKTKRNKTVSPLTSQSPSQNSGSLFSSQRVSQYDIPGLEANLLPSLRDTVNRMTNPRNSSDPNLRRISVPAPPSALEGFVGEENDLIHMSFHSEALNKKSELRRSRALPILLPNADPPGDPPSNAVPLRIPPKPSSPVTRVQASNSSRQQPLHSPISSSSLLSAELPGGPQDEQEDNNTFPPFAVSLRTTKRLTTSDQAFCSKSPVHLEDVAVPLEDVPEDPPNDLRTPRVPELALPSKLPKKKKSGIPIPTKAPSKPGPGVPSCTRNMAPISMTTAPSSSSISDSASSVFRRFLLKPGWSFRGGTGAPTDPVAPKPEHPEQGSTDSIPRLASQGYEERSETDDQASLAPSEMTVTDTDDDDSIRSIPQDEREADDHRHLKTPSMDDGQWSGDEIHRRRRKALVGLVTGLGLGVPGTASRIERDQRFEKDEDEATNLVYMSDDGDKAREAGGYLSPSWISQGRESITPTSSPRISRGPLSDRQSMLLAATRSAPSLIDSHTSPETVRAYTPVEGPNIIHPTPPKRPGPPPIPPRPPSLSPRPQLLENISPRSTQGHWKDHIQLTTVGYRGSLLVPAQERAAFGIPPSTSDIRDSMIGIPHVDSDLSSVGELLRQEEKELGFSNAAVALFDTLGLKSTAHNQDDCGANSLPESESTQTSVSTLSSGASNYEEEEAAIQTGNARNAEDFVEEYKQAWRAWIGEDEYEMLQEEYEDREMRRQAVIWELCESEQSFLKVLHASIRFFILPLKAPDRSWVPGLPTEVARLFDWLEDIVHLHTCIAAALLDIRTAQYPVISTVAEALRPIIHRLEVYQPFLVKVDSVSNTIQEMIENIDSDFGEYVRLQRSAPEGQGVDLLHSLRIPGLRLQQYQSLFEMLLDHTPPSHPDYLSSVSLFHSATTLIRVLLEVKAREEEYEAIKQIASNIDGLPPTFPLARRERRLLAQGLLYIVAKPSIDHGPRPAHDRRPSQMKREMFVMKRGSLDSSYSANSLYREHRTNEQRHASRRRSRSFDSAQAPHVDTPYISTERAVHAFVFTDLLLLTIPSLELAARDHWRLSEEDAITHILDVRILPGRNRYEDYLEVELDILKPPMNDEGIPGAEHTVSASTMSLRIPGTPEVRAKWLSALQHCMAHALQSLSFPAQSGSGSYLAHGVDADLETDTRLTVKSLLAVGLPFPKSPSLQQEDLQSGRPPEHILEEREERGWWTLRFQQVLREVQRRESSMVGSALV